LTKKQFYFTSGSIRPAVFYLKALAIGLHHSLSDKEDSMKKESEDLKMLNELIGVCRDANQGFSQAASEVKNPLFRRLFREKAMERFHFLYNLCDSAAKSGLQPSKEGTFAGKLHRSWFNFRHLLNPREDSVVLKECKRGEEHGLSVYQDVFEKNLLPKMRPELEEQFVKMIEMRDFLRNTEANHPYQSESSVLHLL
jgi:uncharacterized protein (TIGR02284 family)